MIFIDYMFNSKLTSEFIEALHPTNLFLLSDVQSLHKLSICKNLIIAEFLEEELDLRNG